MSPSCDESDLVAVRIKLREDLSGTVTTSTLVLPSKPGALEGETAGIDWKSRVPRFDVVYWLHSFEKDNSRIRVRTGVADGADCPTASGTFLTANWMEREVWDLFGIPFAGHPDLRRILTWDGFQGHPLRKDFPVEGIDTGAAIYPDRYPEGGGPSAKDPNRKVVS